MTVGLFPGQGVKASHVLAELEIPNDTVTQANEILGFDIRRAVRDASRGSRRSFPTSLAQPAIFVAGIASFERARSAGDTFNCFAGHSLGEYAALVASGAMSFSSGLQVVCERGRAMEAAARRGGRGAMAALIGVDVETAEAIADSAGVAVANDNAPGQVVLSGPAESVDLAAGSAAGAGARSVLLEVDGPYHTAAMAPAQKALETALMNVEVRVPEVPVVSNVTARQYRSPGEIRRLLVRQLTERVLFRGAMEHLWDRGVRKVRDLGPGRVVGPLATKTFARKEAVDDPREVHA